MRRELEMECSSHFLNNFDQFCIENFSLIHMKRFQFCPSHRRALNLSSYFVHNKLNHAGYISTGVGEIQLTP